ncbi:GNAT family N-acetyltransferase [Roseibium litorale]|uniref:GNAT family N-acetyltransferase n=1 Tax=Roseibium litorale TaxID=2803841 RepID=A0ABR9CKP6_9HYPH|nr:GNAT family N-acetyltransferase [Roseibium litorale]MBD8891424.1 GNAT family N-acetyltransferase [Roseibium litorale]
MSSPAPAGSAQVIIRPIQTSDLDALLVMNNAAVPAVGELTLAKLRDLIAMASHSLTAERDGKPLGFLLCLPEGTSYASRNYRWLSGQLDRFAYVDRICLAPGARNQGIGESLYQSVIAALTPEDGPVVCEVNTRPDNPGSRRFHARIGFREIGTADYGDMAVVFLQHDAAMKEI